VAWLSEGVEIARSSDPDCAHSWANQRNLWCRAFRLLWLDTLFIALLLSYGDKEIMLVVSTL